MPKHTKLTWAANRNVQDVTLEYDKIVDYKEGSFIQLYDCLVNYPQLKLNDRLVYSAVMAYTKIPNCGGKTNVTNQTIANRLGISPSSVSASVSKLQSLGIISLGCNRNGTRRLIRIERDLSQKTKEQVEWEENNDQDQSNTDYWGVISTPLAGENENATEEAGDILKNEQKKQRIQSSLMPGASIEELRALAYMESAEEKTKELSSDDIAYFKYKLDELEKEYQKMVNIWGYSISDIETVNSRVDEAHMKMAICRKIAETNGISPELKARAEKCRDNILKYANRLEAEWTMSQISDDDSDYYGVLDEDDDVF